MTLYEKIKAVMHNQITTAFICRDTREIKMIMEEEFPFHIDITEIEGFDDLHHCEGILMEAQQRRQPSMVRKRQDFLSMEAL